jgi:hypothetical protein
VLLEEASADVPDDEPTDAHRLWKVVVNPLAPLVAGDVLLKLELNACARLEDVDAMVLYCCSCFDTGVCGDSDVTALLLVAATLFEPAVPGISPVWISAAATAEASVLAESGAVVTGAAGEAVSAFLGGT